MSITPSDSGKTTIAVPNFKGIRAKKMIIHLMADKQIQVAQLKKPIYIRDFNFKGKVYAVNENNIIILKKGQAHYFHDVNDVTGSLSFDKAYLEKCLECGKEIGVDAKNGHALVKRRTIQALWGKDNSHILLLVIMAIAFLVMVIAVLIIYSDSQTAHAVSDAKDKQIQQLLAQNAVLQSRVSK